jgi:3'-phosphoadenosine 5'-phosphosulfate sulfotransferase (PAPS reductase)/FAD synthetase
VQSSEYDEGNCLEKFNPLSEWTEKKIWTYIKQHAVPYNGLHGKLYPSIGCAPAPAPSRRARMFVRDGGGRILKPRNAGCTSRADPDQEHQNPAPSQAPLLKS